jgi:HEAT repeat protein
MEGNESRSTRELIEAALVEPDEEAYSEMLTTLHFRGTREVLDAARELCASEEADRRSLGAAIMGQLGFPERAFPEESSAALLEMLAAEENAEVLEAIAVSLGHLQTIAAVEPLVKLKNHPNARVRESVAFGLKAHEDTRAIAILMELTADQDKEVRNWATFALGQQINIDTPEIREALLRRTDDDDREVRCEALLGLARRKDERVIDPLIKELSTESPMDLALEAATNMADERLLPLLIAFRKTGRADKELIDEAIIACGGAPVKK